ncbi:uncharacterized protein MONOS_8811 [Monocercomonoides exilis]|uniref:uncharacterized protein n=1 Tax=Monocercomonoides exilis TaxID=2049356 RepID=UPI00355A4EB6|nr:hypothetical protein MONOS_8811 [Monocercomonoides exilis]|eukprot:MONOS_8811.1-p1 / transcript=MONOS_8811.1 / gene=MONOS_8811 / organism=Monocercomonoides_exilis_PA203 / gene_product=unspecified product / transcript_product=unspecified product / location=Mono_scaffold00343:23412-25447(+) / protein_length=661 / sequence_SO=supercontig / SO=protein_coding / is_pseudo=false
MELAEVCENIEEVLSPFHRENRINQEIPRDYEMGTWRENTEGDSVNFSRTRQKNDRKSGKEEEKRVLRAFGTVIESPIGSALEESWKIATADTLGGKETAHIQTCQRTPEVRSCAAVGPPKEPLPGRLVNRLSEWKKIGGDKLVSRGIRARWKSPQSPISLEERRHRQEFRGTTETMNSYLSLLEEELKDEVVKPIHESEVKWFNPTFMVRMKNGKWRKILDCRALNEEVQGKHFKMDSQKTVVELLEENDWMTTLDILSEYQHVKVDEQFSPFLYFSFQSQCYANVGMPFGAKDAPRVFTKIMRRAASNIREHWKGCFEIDLTGDSPVPEKSGLDTVGGEAEARTRKERGVSGMAVELREDGSDAPRKEESAALGGCAKVDSTCKEEEDTKDEGLSSTPREVKFREITTPTSELVDETHAIRTEACNSPRRLEWNGDTQPNDVRRTNTLEENSAREQTKESEEKEQTSRANNGRFGAGMGCSINNTDREQRGEDICPRELDTPGEHACNQREGVQSSVEDFRKKRSMAERTGDRSYLSEDRQYVHEMDNPEEERSAITHSNTESTGEEPEQSGHNNTNGTSPGRAKHKSRCTQPDGEKSGLRTEGEESRRDITISRTENTRYNFRIDCAGALRLCLETILSEKVEGVIELLLNKIVLVCY